MATYEAIFQVHPLSAIVLYDGDPFEYTTHVTGVIIDGKVVKQEE